MLRVAGGRALPLLERQGDKGLDNSLIGMCDGHEVARVW